MIGEREVFHAGGKVRGSEVRRPPRRNASSAEKTAGAELWRRRRLQSGEHGEVSGAIVPGGGVGVFTQCNYSF